MERQSRYRWAIISFLWLQQGSSLLAFSTLGLMLPSMQAELNFGTLEAGFLGGSRGVSTILFLVPASMLLVRFNPHWTYTMLLLLTGGSLMAAAMAPSFLPLYALFLLYNVAVSVTQVPVAILRLQWIRPREFATVLSLGNSVGAMTQSASLIAIPWLLSWLSSWRLIFIGLGVFLIALGLLWAVIGREGRPREQRASDRGGASILGVLRRREYLLVGMGMFGDGVGWTTISLFLPTYLLQTRGMDLGAAGMLMGSVPLGGLVSSVMAGAISDRIGRRKPIVACLGLLTPFTYLALLLPIPASLLIPAGLATGFVIWGAWPCLHTVVYEVPGAKPAEVAMGQSVTMSMHTLGVLIGPVVAGALAQITGSLAPGLVLAAVVAGLMGVAGLVVPETGPRGAGRERTQTAAAG